MRPCNEARTDGAGQAHLVLERAAFLGRGQKQGAPERGRDNGAGVELAGAYFFDHGEVRQDACSRAAADKVFHRRDRADFVGNLQVKAEVPGRAGGDRAHGVAFFRHGQAFLEGVYEGNRFPPLGTRERDQNKIVL